MIKAHILDETAFGEVASVGNFGNGHIGVAVHFDSGVVLVDGRGPSTTMNVIRNAETLTQRFARRNDVRIMDPKLGGKSRAVQSE